MKIKIAHNYFAHDIIKFVILKMQITIEWPWYCELMVPRIAVNNTMRVNNLATQ